MSSVGSSDSSNRQDGINRRNREEYQKKESELIKKQHRELRRLSEAHQTEIENLKSTHESQIQNVQDKSRETMSRRDMKHQKEVENIRSIYRKQLTDQSSDNQQRLVAGSDANKREIAQAESQYREKTADMESSHIRHSREQEERFRLALEEMKEDQTAAIDRNKKNIGDRHKKEMEAYSESASREKGDLQREYKNYRLETDSKVKQQELRHAYEKKRASEKLIDSVAGERATQDEIKAQMREGYTEELKKTEEKYDDLRAKDTQDRASANSEFEGKIQDRVDNRIGQLERDNSNLKAQNIRDRVKTDFQKQREIQNAKDAFHANVEDYRRQMESMQDTSNEDTLRAINKIQNENSEIMKTSNRHHLEKSSIDNLKNRQALEGAQNLHKNQQSQLEVKTNQRIKKIVDQSNVDKERMAQNYKTNFDIIQDQKADDLRQARTAHMEEKFQTTERLKEQMQNREVAHQEKLTAITSHHNKQMAEMSDKMLVEKRTQVQNQRRMAEDLQRAHKVELETQQIQYQDKIAQMQQKHDEEMKRVTQRHDEKMNQLAGVKRS